MMTSKTLRVENCSSHCTTPSDRNDPQLVSVKVGCLHINPATTQGRRMFMVQMLVLCFVPHAALIIQNCSAMAQLSQTLDASLYLHAEMRTTLSLGETIVDLQEERHHLVKYMFSQVQDPLDKSKIERAFSVTNSRLEELPQSFLADLHKARLYRFREDFMNAKDFKNQFQKRMSVYEDIYTILLQHVTNHVKSTTSSLWRQLSACYELIKSMEGFYLALTFVNYIKSEGEQKFNRFDQYEAFGLEHLESTVQYLKAENIFEEFRALNDIIDFYKELNPFRRNESQTVDSKEQGERIELYIMESEMSLSKLRSIQIRMWSVVRESVKSEVWVARRTLAVGVTILTVVLLASPILVLIIRHTINTIQTFNHSIELSTQRLMAEKQKSDILLSRMLPMPVLRRLRAQKAVPAEAFDAVTIFFSDIVGFTTISSSSTPMEVINMLNMLYRLFDEKIMQYNVYKVETIGDAYMVVSGLPQRNGNRHASEIADMSLSLLRSLDGAMVPHRPEEPLRIRAGVNTGPCVAGVVGTTMPRYCLFGDTINVASRMESTGEAMKIHISYSTKKALEQIGGYEIQSRGEVDVAGKGNMETFWLLGKMGGVQTESPQALRLHDYDQNLLELLIRA